MLMLFKQTSFLMFQISLLSPAKLGFKYPWLRMADLEI